MEHLLQSGLDFATDPFPYVVDIFNHSGDESAVKMYKKIMKQPKSFIPIFTALNLVKQGTLAYNTDGIYAYAILSSNISATKIWNI